LPSSPAVLQESLLCRDADISSSPASLQRPVMKCHPSMVIALRLYKETKMKGRTIRHLFKIIAQRWAALTTSLNSRKALYAACASWGFTCEYK